MTLPNDYPDAAEFGLLRAYLAINKFTQAWIKEVIGNDPSAYTRAEIADLLKAAMKELPKAGE